jgi:hypothetical protein
MDWFILIVVVPLVLVPLVLLYGFAGCGEFGSAPPSDPPPFDLVATGKGVDHIALEWNHASPATVSFTIARKAPGEAAFDEDYRAGVLQTTFDDKPIPAGLYHYKVRAVVNASPTGWSDEAQAQTLVWKEAYASQGTPVFPAADFSGRCIVQKVDPAVLKSGGKRVRITLFNGSASPLVVQRIYVSHPEIPGAPANPMPDPWDSRNPVVPVLETGITINPNSTATHESKEFQFDNNEPLLISFDITSGFVTRWTTGIGTSIAYDRQIVEAGSANRAPNYGQREDSVLLVTKIEALT